MALTTAQQAFKLFKKLMGVGESSASRDFFEEPKQGRQAILPNQIWTEMPPTTAPTLSDGQTSGCVKKWVDKSLSAIPGTTNSFWHADIMGTIPFNYGDGSYNYTLKDSTGATIPFGQGDWVLDPESGVLIFYNSTPANMPPKLTCFVYVGPTGLDNYALLPGRSGGQTLAGGTAADDTLTLEGNTATTGNTATNANLQFKVGDSAGTTAVTILNNGNVGIGTATPESRLEVSGLDSVAGPMMKLTSESTAGADVGRGYSADHYSPDTRSSNLQFRKSRGSKSTPSGALINDVVGSITFTGARTDAPASFAGGGAIEAIVDTDPSGSNVPVGLNFSTGTTPNVRMRIDSVGNVGIGTTTNASYALNVNGKVNLAGGSTYDIDGSPHTHSQYATLDENGKVVQDPANATATPTASKIVIADTGGKVDGWVSDASTSVKGKVQLASDAETIAGTETTKAVTPSSLTAKVDTNTALGSSDTKIPSQKAVKSYVDASVAGLLDDRGSFDASDDTFPSTGGSGESGAILKGDIWYISVAGVLGGTAVTIGDSVRALVDSPGQTASNWSILETNIGYVPENVANKGVASGYASLDTNSKVVQDPANATATPTASKIVIADASAKVDGWVSDASTSVKGKIQIATDTETITGTDQTKAVTPYDLAAKTDNDTTLAGDAATKVPTQHAVKTYADTKIPLSQKAAASGVASLDENSKVVQDPANATATPTASKIVIADSNAKVDGWISGATTSAAGKVQLASDAETITGTETVKAVTPSNLTAKIDTDGTLAGNADTRIASQKATKTYADTKIPLSQKAAASGVASLDANSKVVQDPANATATPTASKIVIADASAKVDGWVSDASTSTKGKIQLATDAETITGTNTTNAVTPSNITAKIDTSTSLGTSDTMIPSQNAVKTYIDNATSGLLNDRGSYDASGNVFPSSGGSGVGGAIRKGDIWYISVAGTLGGSPVTLGDSVRALTNAPGQTASNWSILETNIGYVPENVANKGVASGYASLDTNSKVVQDPANATATPTASKIVIADASAKVDGWVSDASTSVKGKIQIATDTETITGTDQTKAVTPYDLTAKIDIDGALTGNSDSKIASQKATKTYADTKVPNSQLSTTGGTGHGTQVPLANSSGIIDSAWLTDATTSAKGVVELATNQETIDGSDSSRAITAAGLTAKLDTDGTLVGNSDTRIASQKATKTYADTKVPNSQLSTTGGTGHGTQVPLANSSGIIDSAWITDATTSAKGVVELATNQETIDGSDSSRAITAAGLTAKVSTSTTLGGALTSDSYVPSQKAAKTYVDDSVLGLLDDCGAYDASGDTFPVAGSGSGEGGAIMKGDTWYISVTGHLNGVMVVPGDTLRALTDTPGQTASNWNIITGTLGSGATSGTTFLAGDRTWKTVAGGGYGGVYKVLDTETITVPENKIMFLFHKTEVEGELVIDGMVDSY